MRKYLGLDFDITVQVLEGNWFLHCNVYHWSVETALAVRRVFIGVKQDAKEAGQELLFSFTPNINFAYFVEPWDDCTPYDGKNYFITWRL